MSEEAQVATDACWLLPLCCSPLPLHPTYPHCLNQHPPPILCREIHVTAITEASEQGGSGSREEGVWDSMASVFWPVPGDLGSTGPDNDSQKLLQTFQRDFRGNIWAFATLWQSSGHQMRCWEEEEWEMLHNPILNGFLLKSVSHWNSQKKI